jgi:6-phosphogluconolactonase/glucosamine-6-phosphate isomerase/deaminase
VRTLLQHSSPMKLEVLADAETVAQEGARIIAAGARAAVAARGRFIAAISGGHTPWRMLRALAKGRMRPANRSAHSPP